MTLRTRLWEHRSKAGMDPDEFVRRVELPAKEIREASFWIAHREVALGDLKKVLHCVNHPSSGYGRRRVAWPKFRFDSDGS